MPFSARQSGFPKKFRLIGGNYSLSNKVSSSTASMVRQVMPEFKAKKNVIILCDSWYVKKDLAAIVDDYENLDLIGNARSDSVLYDLPPAPTGRKGRPPNTDAACPSTKTLPCPQKRLGTIIPGAAVSWPISLGQGRFWLM